MPIGKLPKRETIFKRRPIRSAAFSGARWSWLTLGLAEARPLLPQVAVKVTNLGLARSAFKLWFERSSVAPVDCAGDFQSDNIPEKSLSPQGAT